MQQQKQLPQAENGDWQSRLAESMAGKEWKYGNSVLAELPTEMAVEALLDQYKRDYVLRMLYLRLIVLAYLSLGAVVGYAILSDAVSRVQFRIVLRV